MFGLLVSFQMTCIIIGGFTFITPMFPFCSDNPALSWFCHSSDRSHRWFHRFFLHILLIFSMFIIFLLCLNFFTEVYSLVRTFFSLFLFFTDFFHLQIFCYTYKIIDSVFKYLSFSKIHELE